MSARSAKEVASDIAAIPTETVIQSMGKGLMMMSLGEKVMPPWRRPAAAFEMLKELQEHGKDGAASWIVVWGRAQKRWACSLVGWDQTIPGWDRDGPRKVFYADVPYDCVRKAWESEKEARRMNDG